MESNFFIKSIDGEIFYRYDYADFLYQELQKRDDKISKVIEYIEKSLIPFGNEWHWDNAAIYDEVVKLLNILKENK